MGLYIIQCDYLLHHTLNPFKLHNDIKLIRYKTKLMLNFENRAWTCLAEFDYIGLFL